MCRLRGIVVPITVGLLITATATACTSTNTADSASGKPLTATSATTPNQPSATARATASESESQSSSGSRPSSTPSQTTTNGPASRPFPGIWDITSWQAYRKAQASVAQGHQPWLLDPELVVSAWAARWTPVPAVHQVAADTFQLTEPGTTVVYTIHGTRPDPDSATPIWVITAISHT